MHFCSECSNMYYLRMGKGSDTSLTYYCRNCGHEDAGLATDGLCVSSTTLKRSSQKYAHVVSAYTKDDPTLPRTTAIRCPDPACPGAQSGQNEVIYMRYDDSRMKYLYICAACDTMWKTDNV